MTQKQNTIKSEQERLEMIQVFLEKLKVLKITPNFFCSSSYLFYSGAVVKVYDGWEWIEADDGVYLFPPITFLSKTNQGKFSGNFVWSDFSDYGMDKNLFRAKFLDWEYIYDPAAFLNMKGHIWNKFRKNIVKWPNLNPEWAYGYITVTDAQKATLLCDWMEKRESTLEDSELIYKYVMEPISGVYQQYLFNGTELVGINICDINYKYVNYRLCICKDEPFLDEFMRFKFYMSVNKMNKIYSKSNDLFVPYLVNDGGSLGNPGLEFFKDKMNPISKRMVFGWERK